MKKLILILPILFFPFAGYSQSNAYYIGESKTQVINEVKDKYEIVPKKIIQLKGIEGWEYLELNWKTQKYLYRGRFNKKTGICTGMELYPLNNTIFKHVKKFLNTKYLQVKVYNNETAWVLISKNTSIFIQMLSGGINDCKYHFYIKSNKSL